VSDDELGRQFEAVFADEEAVPSLGDLFSDAEVPDLDALFSDGRASSLVEKADKQTGAPADRKSGKKVRRSERGLGLGLRLFSRERLTLSLETSEVRLLVARGQRIVRWGSIALPEGVVRNGQVVQPDAFGQVLAGAVKEVKGPRRRAIVSLQGQRALVRILSLPEVPSRMLDETLRRQARRELPLPLEELYLSWQIVSNRKASHLEAFTLGIPRDAVDNCVAGLRSAGVRPVAMDLKVLALVRAVNLADVVLADLEAETGLVAVVRGFVPQIVRSVTLPGGAEQPPAERTSHMISEIRRIIDFYHSTRVTSQPAWSPTVCLTGALGDEEEVRSQVEAVWPLVEPEPPVEIPKALPLLSYLTNIGLALKSVGRGRR
jgi:hypothetical protein